MAESKQAVTHRLYSTDETRMKYPFKFGFLIIHWLDSENPRLLHVDWEVKNNSSSQSG